MGKHLPSEIDPHNLYFVAIGVEDLDGLECIEIYAGEDDYVKFIEPDINNEMTAIAFLPVTGKARNKFSKYKTLRF